jgi:hypothetical protein
MPYGPGDLDILSRAFEGALSCLPESERGLESTKAALMAGILEAAKAGERDEDELIASALAAMSPLDEGSMDAVMRTAPL